MANIDLITYIAEGSAPYAEFLKKTAKAFRSGKHTINWRFMVSGNTNVFPQGFEYIGRTKQERISSSYNHSIAVNKSLGYIKSEYAVIIDADIALLYRGWDDVIVNELDTGVSCFGFNRPRENFPSVFLFSFKKDLLNKVVLDFRPKVSLNEESVNRYYIDSEAEAKYRHSHIKGLVKCDTGWKLPMILKGDGKCMDCVLSKNPLHQLPFSSAGQKRICLKKSEHMCEWHYNGKIFGTHKQASRAHRIDGFYGRIWRKRINMYIKNEYGFTL